MEDEKLDLGLLCEILDEYGSQRGAVIPMLQKAQGIYGWLPREVLQEISRRMRVPLSQIYGIVTFYSQFYLQRRGKHIIRQCDGTACHVRGAPKIVEGISEAYNLDPGGSDPEYKYTLEIVYCLGSCGLAPIAVVDDQVYGQTTSEKLVEQMRQLE